MKKILIVGGGMGGTILANNLARRLTNELKTGKVRITMLSASEKHMYQPGLLYLAVGKITPDELYRDQASLLEPGIEFHVDPVEEFKGGKVVITVGVPHKCPMAPLEITFMLHDYFKDRGMADKVQLLYTYPIGRVHSLENVAKWAAPEMDKLGIKYETFFNIKEVDAKNKVLKSEEGNEIKYDLLITIPAHKGMEVLEKNGMGQGGWIPTNKTKLNMEGRDNVFVLGDTTNIPISKAGSTAHFQADTLGENLAAMVKIGMPVREYDGKVFCFIEAGKDRASYAMFDYKNPPDPKAPTKAVHWFKMAYNKLYWISARGLL